MEKSNRDDNWAKHYGVYAVNFREVYKTVVKPQNESHFIMLQHRLNKYMNGRMVFAEIGFGAGLTLRKANNYFSQVYGLDISPQNIELTRKELEEEGYQNINLFVSDILVRDERFKKKFDIISFIHGIEHFSTDDYHTFFENIRYYLKPGGIFTGALPNNLPFNYRMCPKCEHVFEIDGHLSRHTKDTLRSLFDKHNFEILHISDFNYQYYWKFKGVVRTVFYFVIHVILNKTSNMDIEFIVKPG